KGTHEQAKSMPLGFGTHYVFGHPDAALDKHALKLIKIGRGQWLVRPQFADGDVVVMSAQERPGFRAELDKVSAFSETGERDTGLGPDHILEVGIEGLALLLLDKRYEAT